MLRRYLFLLPLLAALFVYPASAEDMPALENYELPPRLFDTEAPKDTSPFLTGIDPQKLEEAKPAPKPPVKPKAPVKLSKKIDLKKVKAPTKPVVVKKAVAKTTKSTNIKPPASPSEIAKQMEQLKVVNPNVRDILASIEGIEPVKASGKGRTTLQFLPGDTSLTLDMKNILLKDYIPVVKAKPKTRIEIHAYALPDKTGETGARRVSLARALETRDFLIAAGLDSGRIDVMPEGDAVESDHVELITREPKE